MPGQPTFSTAGAYSGNPVPGAANSGGAPSHTWFLVWVVIIGIVLPAVILGGLNVNGFSFVFKGR